MSWRIHQSKDTRASFANRFGREIANHRMQVIRDDGVYRHLRFRQPATWCMGFDILTWPGHLCYTGDMGSFLFKRMEDMFEFFRGNSGRERGQMDMNYWAEKVHATDKNDGISEWSADQFRSDVRYHFEQCVDAEEWPEDRKRALWEEIEREVLGYADEGEHLAFGALSAFEHDRFRFQDFECSCHVFTYRFTWCCHAIEWAIDTFDAYKAQAPSAE